MNWKVIASAVLFCFVLAASAGATTYTSSDGTFSLSAKSVEIYSARLVASGNAHVKWLDRANKTTLDANAEKITVTTMQAPKGDKNAKSTTVVKTATLLGPTRMVYTFVDASGPSKVTATADNADYDGATNLAHLTGNVRISNENPALFAEPATMTGDSAVVNLKPGPDDFRFRIESSPGMSTITATPQPKQTGK